MKPTLTLLTLAMLSGLPISHSSFARESDVLDYAIGGGPVISLPARENNIKSTKLGLGWDANLQCGQLDPKLTVENQLNGLTDGFQDMMGSVLQSATSAVASLPGYLIQKEDPGLYDLLTNGVLQGKFDFDDGLTSCEAMSETMGDTLSNNDYYAQAKAELWAKEARRGDAVKAKKTCWMTWATLALLGAQAGKPVAVVSPRLNRPKTVPRSALRCWLRAKKTMTRRKRKDCTDFGTPLKRFQIG